MFRFEKDDVVRHIRYELKTLERFKEPLRYVIRQLVIGGHAMTIKNLKNKINLNKMKEYDGKNYHWSVVTHDNVTLMFRRYKYHFTIFTIIDKGMDKYDNKKLEYGAFTLNTDFDKFGELHNEMMDTYYDASFTDMNVIIKDLLKLLMKRDNGIDMVWNSYALKRPNHVDIKLVFSDNNINSIDLFVFCMEELESIFVSLFSENTMIQRIKEYKPGDMFNERYKITSISTKLKDDYYHAIGLGMKDVDDKPNTIKSIDFKDVYTLTMYYFDTVFKDRIYFYDGEIYVKGSEFVDGQPVTYKDKDLIGEVIIFRNSFYKEKLIPLKRYEKA